MTAWLALLLTAGPLTAASSLPPDSIEIFNGVNYVIATPTPGGPYVAERPNGVRYMTTANHDYGFPFTVLDQGNNVLFFLRYDESGDKEVSFWRIGDEMRFTALIQKGRTSSRRQRCRQDLPGLAITNYSGEDEWGNRFDIEERAPFPPALCPEDRLSYSIAWRPAPGQTNSEALQIFVDGFWRSLYELFGVGPSEVNFQIVTASATN